MRCNLPATHVSGNGFRTCQTHTDLGYGNRANMIKMDDAREGYDRCDVPCPQSVVEVLNSTIVARLNCRSHGNAEWAQRHTDTIKRIAKDLLPSGSGVDCGTTVDLECSIGDRIVLHTSYHHMDDDGGYDGWTEHIITIRPSFLGNLTLSISGKNRNDIKEYLHDLYDTALNAVAPEDLQRTGVRPVTTV
jgi:hypothetical protein